jgi:transcriptional regulator with XRE-family HTH domain
MSTTSGVNQPLTRAQARVGKPELQRSRRSRVQETLPNVSTASTEATPRGDRSRRSGARSRTYDRPFARANAIPRPKYGPQTMIRQQSGTRIYGRPDEAEQRQIAETVGARLRELRREYKLSIRDLERRSGVSRSSISLLERGLRRPRESMLGWLAAGLVGLDGAEAVKQDLVIVAGDLTVAESRWSERSHARRAWRQVQVGGILLPTWLAAPYAVAILGGVLPGEMDKLRQAQEAARAGGLPWPEHAIASREVFCLATELDQANLHELRNIGRGIIAADKARAARERRRRNREMRARLGLTGTDSRRPIRIPRGIPAEEREMYANLIQLKRSTDHLSRGAR